MISSVKKFPDTVERLANVWAKLLLAPKVRERVQPLHRCAGASC